MIEIKSVTKNYGDFTAIENISFKVEDASVFGIAGFNGSGKTTLLNICAGILKADKGGVFLDGKDSFDNDKERLSLFFLRDDIWFPSTATIKSAAKYYSAYYPDFDFSVFQDICSLFGLKSSASVKSLSKGMTRQAALAIAFAARPKYLLIDETFDGLDPHKKDIVRRLLLEYINKTDASVIISSHDLGEISGVCDHIAIINGKNIVMNCAIEDVSEHFRRIKMIFDRPVTEVLFKGINYRRLKLSGRAVSLIICGDIPAELKKLEALGAADLQAEPLSLEEVFAEETEGITDNEKIKSIF